MLSSASVTGASRMRLVSSIIVESASAVVDGLVEVKKKKLPGWSYAGCIIPPAE